MRKKFAFLTAGVAAILLFATSANAQSEFKKSYASDMKAFVEQAQQNYPFFDLKGIRKDWKATSKRLE